MNEEKIITPEEANEAMKKTLMTDLGVTRKKKFVPKIPNYRTISNDLFYNIKTEKTGGEKKMYKNQNHNAEHQGHKVSYDMIISEAKKASRYINFLFGYFPKITMSSYDQSQIRLNDLGLLLGCCRQNAWFTANEKTYDLGNGTFRNMRPGKGSSFTVNVGDKINIGGIEVTATSKKTFTKNTMEAGKWTIIYWGKFTKSEEHSGYCDGYVFQLFKETNLFNEYKEEKRKFYASSNGEEEPSNVTVPEKVEETEEKKEEEVSSQSKENEVKISEKRSKKKVKVEIEMDPEKMKDRILENSVKNM